MNLSLVLKTLDLNNPVFTPDIISEKKPRYISEFINSFIVDYFLINFKRELKKACKYI
jgi:hypothetical protein